MSVPLYTIGLVSRVWCRAKLATLSTTGQLETPWLDVSFVELFGFVCERCAITVQVRQNS